MASQTQKNNRIRESRASAHAKRKTQEAEVFEIKLGKGRLSNKRSGDLLI